MPHTETLTAVALMVWSSLSKKRALERAHGKAGKGGCLDQEVFSLDKHWPSWEKRKLDQERIQSEHVVCLAILTRNWWKASDPIGAGSHWLHASYLGWEETQTYAKHQSHTSRMIWSGPTAWSLYWESACHFAKMCCVVVKCCQQIHYSKNSAHCTGVGNIN